MAKRKAGRTSSFRREDLASWNFIIFLTLAFILLVLVLSAMKGVTQDLRSRAGLGCPNPLAAFGGQLPAPESCSGGKYSFERSAENGCAVLVCKSSTPSK